MMRLPPTCLFWPHFMDAANDSISFIVPKNEFQEEKAFIVLLHLNHHKDLSTNLITSYCIVYTASLYKVTIPS